MSRTIIVGMADLQLSKAPDVLTTLGLGSCIGIVLFDWNSRIGGMAHIMLPARLNPDDPSICKFADTALEELVKQMVQAGAMRPFLKAKLAGGANMFPNNTSSATVGEKNIIATTALLKQMNIPIAAQDVGGGHGRTIKFFTETGELHIKTIGKGEKII